MTHPSSRHTNDLSPRYIALSVILGLLYALWSTGCSTKPTDSDTAFTTTYIRDDAFLRNRYFWLLNPFTDSVWAQRYARGDSIVSFRLFRTANFEDQDVSPPALVMPDSLQGLTIDSVRNTDTIFHSRQRRANVWEIVPRDYIMDRHRFWVTLSDNNPINEAQLLGYYVEIQTPFGIDTIGAIADSFSVTLTSLILTMLKPDDELRPSHPCWLLEWKNVYDLGIRDIAAGGMSVDVYLGARGTEDQAGQNLNTVSGTRFMEILGLDRLAWARSPVPVGLNDDSLTYLDHTRGHLYFPNSFPFSPSLYPIPTASIALPYPLGLTQPIFDQRRTYARNGTLLESEPAGVYSGELMTDRQESSMYYLEIRLPE